MARNSPSGNPVPSPSNPQAPADPGREREDVAPPKWQRVLAELRASVLLVESAEELFHIFIEHLANENDGCLSALYDVCTCVLQEASEEFSAAAKNLGARIQAGSIDEEWQARFDQRYSLRVSRLYSVAELVSGQKLEHQVSSAGLPAGRALLSAIAMMSREAAETLDVALSLGIKFAQRRGGKP